MIVAVTAAAAVLLQGRTATPAELRFEETRV